MSIDFEMFIDRPGVMAKLTRAGQRIYARTGGYVMQRMRRSIRRPKPYKQMRKIALLGRLYYNDRQEPGYEPQYSPGKGWIIRWDIFQEQGKVVKATRDDAALVLNHFYAAKKADAAGKPPRRGPRDTLRNFILFGYSVSELLIGPHNFPQQPGGIRAANTGTSIPDLLESGGMAVHMMMGSAYVAHYNPHPYVEPQRSIALRKFRDETARELNRL